MTIIACCISLKMIKKILVVLGVVDMRQLLLKRDSSPQDFLYPKILPRSKELSIPRSLKEVRKFGRSVRLRRSREIKEVRNFRG